MKFFKLIPLLFISLNVLSFSIENFNNFLEAAKVNEYQKFYSNCPTSEERFECKSNDQLELVLKLLKNGRANKKFAPKSPESEIRRDRNGYVILTLKVNKDGVPINSKLKEAKCGQGDINIQKNWKMNCNMFVSAAKKSIADWRFDQVLINDVPIELDKGDAVIYAGTEFKHYREKFEGDYCVNVFLHYVRKNGIYKDFKYDKRMYVGTNKTSHPGAK